MLTFLIILAGTGLVAGIKSSAQISPREASNQSWQEDDAVSDIADGTENGDFEFDVHENIAWLAQQGSSSVVDNNITEQMHNYFSIDDDERETIPDDESDISSCPPISKALPSGKNYAEPSTFVNKDDDGSMSVFSLMTRESDKAADKKSLAKQCLGDSLNQLFNACRSGDAALVKRIREDSNVQIDVNRIVGYAIGGYEGPDPWFPRSSFENEVIEDVKKENIKRYADDSTSTTVLNVASSLGHAQVVQQLLAFQDIDVNKGNHQNVTALFAACSKGHLETVKVLLSCESIDVNKSNEMDMTPLMVAIDKVDICRLLVSHPNIDVNAKFCFDQETVVTLWNACMGGDQDSVHSILDRPSINVTADTYESAGIFAIQGGHTEILDMLTAQKDAIMNYCKREYDTALSLASEKGSTEVVKMLLDHPEIDINENKSGEIALTSAALNGNFEITKMLVDHPNIHVEVYVFVVECAARKGHAAVLKLLLDRQYDRDDQHFRDPRNGHAALVMATKNNRAETVKMLLDRQDVDVNKCNSMEQTAFHYACDNGFTEIVRMLLERHDLNVNQKCQDFLDCIDQNQQCIIRCKEKTALHYASENGHVAIVKRLLNHDSINVDLKDTNDKTALNLATEKGNTAIVELLQDHVAMKTPSEKKMCCIQ